MSNGYIFVCTILACYLALPLRLFFAQHEPQTHEKIKHSNIIIFMVSFVINMLSGVALTIFDAHCVSSPLLDIALQDNKKTANVPH